ncbi:MAG: DUF134 domain-containing protein [Candidatus Peribacteraceae bacterium]|jgi:predicted DNA-binding protein (UPF0251 family)|nr:DUF134 domain-containing protein [Candidatus Peribacteraceae bacterium]
MIRPLKPRCIGAEPEALYYKPRGIPLSGLEQVVLTLDEVEALRLKYLEEMDQTKAAKRMGVSQSTFQRILVQVNRKTADALLNGKAIKIEGGVIRKRR